MFLSLLKLNGAHKAVRRDMADCQQLHRTVMSTFAQAGDNTRARLNVLYRLEVCGTDHVLYVQSQTEPDWARLPAGYCIPGGANCKPVDNNYAAITPGTALRFRLRANPTKRLPANCPGEKRDGPRVNLEREEDQIAWLQRRAKAAGFTLLSVQVNPDVSDVRISVEPGRVHGRHRDGRLTFGAVRFEGRLRVLDAELFRRALENGVGSGKAYGFGLLSVAPVSEA
jgi:CRISPR system Cascade subunit CasE